MVRYVGSRLLQAIWVVWAAFTVSFVVLYLLPADPVSMAADGAGTGTPVDKAAIGPLRAGQAVVGAVSERARQRGDR